MDNLNDLEFDFYETEKNKTFLIKKTKPRSPYGNPAEPHNRGFTLILYFNKFKLTYKC